MHHLMNEDLKQAYELAKTESGSLVPITPAFLKKMCIRDRYKLYPTVNIYNFLQIDTMTGKIEIVQWSLDDDKEGSATLNDEDLSLGLSLIHI